MAVIEFKADDVANANTVAKNMRIEDIPQILVSAMNGVKPQVAGVPDNLVSDISINDEDSPVRGLILSKDHIVKIKTYVAMGLIFPTEDNKTKTFLNYGDLDNSKYPQLSPAEFTSLFRNIKNHCSLWSTLEARIKKTGTSLNLFGQKFVITGGDIVSIIDVMPVIERLRTLGQYDEKHSVPFGEDDQMIKLTLLELLDILKKEIAIRQDETHKLLDDLISFRETMDNVIVPHTAIMNNSLSTLSMDEKRAALLTRRQELVEEIEALDKSYSKMCGMAFTGAAGLVFGPLGIISWAITGGIFGDKAEKARKARNKRKAELEKINAEFESISRLISFVSKTTDKMTDISVVISDAVTGVQNLEVLWDAVAQYIDDSAQQLADVNETTKLLIFSTKLKSSVKSWENVRDITSELVRLFEAAAKEAKVLADEQADEELAKGA